MTMETEQFKTLLNQVSTTQEWSMNFFEQVFKLDNLQAFSLSQRRDLLQAKNKNMTAFKYIAIHANDFFLSCLLQNIPAPQMDNDNPEDQPGAVAVKQADEGQATQSQFIKDLLLDNSGDGQPAWVNVVGKLSVKLFLTRLNDNDLYTVLSSRKDHTDMQICFMSLCGQPDRDQQQLLACFQRFNIDQQLQLLMSLTDTNDKTGLMYVVEHQLNLLDSYLTSLGNYKIKLLRQCDSQHRSVLMLLAEKDPAKVAAYLKGFNPQEQLFLLNQSDNQGFTLLNYLAKNFREGEGPRLSQYLQRLEQHKKLALLQTTHRGETVLMRIAKQKPQLLLQLLQDLWADQVINETNIFTLLTQSNKENQTIVKRFSQEEPSLLLGFIESLADNPQIIIELLKHHDNEGWTALMLVALKEPTHLTPLLSFLTPAEQMDALWFSLDKLDYLPDYTEGDKNKLRKTLTQAFIHSAQVEPEQLTAAQILCIKGALQDCDLAKEEDATLYLNARSFLEKNQHGRGPVDTKLQSCLFDREGSLVVQRFETFIKLAGKDSQRLMLILQQQNTKYSTALMHVARYHPKYLERCFEGLSNTNKLELLKQQESGGWTALMAVARYHPAYLERCFEGFCHETKLALLKQQNKEGNTTLMHVAQDHPKYLGRCFEGLSHVNRLELLKQQDNEGWTALMQVACYHPAYLAGCFEGLSHANKLALLRQQNNKEWTALMHVARYHPEHLETCFKDLPPENKLELLKQQNNGSWTALILVACYHPAYLETCFKDLPPENKLALLKHHDNEGWTALMLVALEPTHLTPLLSSLTPAEQMDALWFSLDKLDYLPDYTEGDKNKLRKTLTQAFIHSAQVEPEQLTAEQILCIKGALQDCDLAKEEDVTLYLNARILLEKNQHGRGPVDTKLQSCLFDREGSLVVQRVETFIKLAGKDSQRLMLILQQQQDNHGNTALIHVVRNHPEHLERCLKDLPPENKLELLKQCNNKGWTALMMVARYHPEYLELCFEGLSNTSKLELLKQQESGGWTALMMVTRYHPAYLETCFKDLPPESKQALLKQQDSEGWTALMMVARAHPEHLERCFEDLPPENKLELLKQCNNKGLTALMHVARNHPEYLKQCLSFLDQNHRSVLLQQKIHADETTLDWLLQHTPGADELLQCLCDQQIDIAAALTTSPKFDNFINRLGKDSADKLLLLITSSREPLELSKITRFTNLSHLKGLLLQGLEKVDKSHLERIKEVLFSPQTNLFRILNCERHGENKGTVSSDKLTTKSAKLFYRRLLAKQGVGLQLAFERFSQQQFKSFQNVMRTADLRTQLKDKITAISSEGNAWVAAAMTQEEINEIRNALNREQSSKFAARLPNSDSIFGRLTDRRIPFFGKPPIPIRQPVPVGEGVSFVDSTGYPSAPLRTSF